MRRGWMVWCSAAVVAAVGAGCSVTPAPPINDGVKVAPEALPPPTNPATILGVIPPAIDDIPSVIVLRSQLRGRYLPQSSQPLMDQVAHTFTPGVLVVRTGQPANFRNDDDVLHDVRVRERDREGDVNEWIFNVVLPQGGSFVHTFERDGVYEVRCDMHQSMWARVVAAPTPYNAVADRDGSFRIDGVRAGAYTAIVYAGHRTLERGLEVSEGEQLELRLVEVDGRPANGP